MKKIFIALFCCVALVGYGQCISGDCENGQGTYTYANGDKYVGEFKDGLKNGKGTYTFASGNKYVGKFKDDKYNGKGTATLADGSIYHSGLWKDGKPVK